MRTSVSLGFALAFLLVTYDATSIRGDEPILTVPGLNDPLCVSVELPKSAKVPVGPLTLVEAGYPDNKPTVQAIPSMAGDGQAVEDRVALVGTLAPGERVGKERRFRLALAEEAADSPLLELTELNDKSLQVSDGGEAVLVYNFGVITGEDVPDSDHRRSRACYIHPVYGLNGELLTDDFPRDHYHHHGIFWTWPHVVVDGKEHDLWAGNTIRQQFVSWIARESGPAVALVGVENGWFVDDEKVMIERVWIRVYHAAGGARAVDIDLTLIPTNKPVTLWGAPGKSYGGLTMRFKPPVPRQPDTVITTPSGPTRTDLTTTILRWADYTARFDGREEPSGAAIFISPDHPDYPPEWLLRYYGPLCVGWPGVHRQTLEPGTPVRMSYRIWIHKNAPGTSELTRAYAAYLAGLKASWSE